MVAEGQLCNLTRSRPPVHLQRDWGLLARSPATPHHERAVDEVARWIAAHGAERGCRAQIRRNPAMLRCELYNDAHPFCTHMLACCKRAATFGAQWARPRGAALERRAPAPVTIGWQVACGVRIRKPQATPDCDQPLLAAKTSKCFKSW